MNAVRRLVYYVNKDCEKTRHKTVLQYISDSGDFFIHDAIFTSLANTFNIFKAFENFKLLFK